MKAPGEKGKYTVLEGNRRLAAIRLLGNRTVLDALDVLSPIKKRLEGASLNFDLKTIEPIACFEVRERAEANGWISQRHSGENQGRGIVGWDGIATARFRGADPALQALELVLARGDLSDKEKEAVQGRFPITTLDRLLSTPAVRSKIGAETSRGKLKTNLPAAEFSEAVA